VKKGRAVRLQEPLRFKPLVLMGIEHTIVLASLKKESATESGGEKKGERENGSYAIADYPIGWM